MNKYGTFLCSGIGTGQKIVFLGSPSCDELGLLRDYDETIGVTFGPFDRA